MIDPAVLLALTPTKAVVAMYRDMANLALPLGYAQVSDPVDLGDGRVEVTITIRDPQSADEDLGWKGTQSVTYPRADLQAFFAGRLDDFVPVLPTTTQSLIDALSTRYGIVFDETDFLIENLSQTVQLPYYLKAGPQSLRWRGQLAVDWSNALPPSS